jgi:hypothetical protein
VARGATWRVDGRPPLASGATATKLSPGLHRVTFARVTPFRPPVTVKVAVDEARTTFSA